MQEILHKVEIQTTTESLYQSIVSAEGLSGWWAHTIAGKSVGDLTQVFFGPNRDHEVQMRIKELEPNKKVVWQCENGPWQETGEMTFEITETEQGSALNFSHVGWPEANDFFRHCNSKWGYFLTVSLKPYLESGTGVPNPLDSNI